MIGFASHAQSQSSPSAPDVESWFDSVIGIANSGIIDGPEYKMEFVGYRSDPFLKADAVKGSVRYKGETFHVPLIYDIYKDELIIKHPRSSGNIWFVQLDKKLVGNFSLEHR